MRVSVCVRERETERDRERGVDINIVFERYQGIDIITPICGMKNKSRNSYNIFWNLGPQSLPVIDSRFIESLTGNHYGLNK